MPTEVKRVWPWDDDGCHPADCLLVVDRLPSPPNFGAREPQERLVPAISEVLAKPAAMPAWQPGNDPASDPDKLDGYVMPRFDAA